MVPKLWPLKLLFLGSLTIPWPLPVMGNIFGFWCQIDGPLIRGMTLFLASEIVSLGTVVDT